jgi:hypothetical protein
MDATREHQNGRIRQVPSMSAKVTQGQLSSTASRPSAFGLAPMHQEHSMSGRPMALAQGLTLAIVIATILVCITLFAQTGTFAQAKADAYALAQSYGDHPFTTWTTY